MTNDLSQPLIYGVPEVAFSASYFLTPQCRRMKPARPEPSR